MPNIKSAEKRVKVIEKKTAENRAVKSRISTMVRKFKVALESGDLAAAEVNFKEVVALLDKAAAENVIHQNSANRKKAHYAKLLDSKKNA